MATYTLSMRTDDGGQDERNYSEQPTEAQIRAACQEFCQAGEWGYDGAEVDVIWSLADEDGDEIDNGRMGIQIPVDHASLIRKAGGDPTCDHDWSGEGHGGCQENPGVMSLGGTTLSITEHCTHCGLVRRTLHRGRQRNPGEPIDSVSYEQPE